MGTIVDTSKTRSFRPAIAMTAHTSKLLSLYKSLLRAGAEFPDYNFRMYALRRTRSAFKDGHGEKDPQVLASAIVKAETQLAIIKRQTSIGQMYPMQKNVMEFN